MKDARDGVAVPQTKLVPETLCRLCKDSVTRDGTDHGAVERSLEQKTAALLRRFERGEAPIVFDLEAETFNIITPEAPPR